MCQLIKTDEASGVGHKLFQNFLVTGLHFLPAVGERWLRDDLSRKKMTRGQAALQGLILKALIWVTGCSFGSATLAQHLLGIC